MPRTNASKARPKPEKRSVSSRTLVQPRASETRAKIASVAIQLFRKRGFAKTTMREIARASKLALGATYYYFPSKEAIVLDYYASTERLHREACAPVFAVEKSLAARVHAVFRTKLELAARDRNVLVGLLSSAVVPKSPVGVFGPENKAIRDANIALFAEALEGAEGVPLSREAIALGAAALWAAHMGLLLYFLYDDSPNGEKTYQLLDRTAALVVPLVPLLAMNPELIATVTGVLADARIVDDSGAPQRSTGSGPD